jgi:tRNA-dihydrouridine synthase
MFRETGCDGVMVGRAAISNPWVLAKITAAVKGVAAPTDPSLTDRIEVALEHLRLMIAYDANVTGWQEALASSSYAQAELWACRHLRGQLPLYIKGIPGAAQLRDRITKCSTYTEVEGLLAEFAQTAAEANSASGH